ncbi:single-stranded DNA-binding protein [Halalkalibacter sp. APA_J-10(15)]|uniref:single-stranded DNA-binding protein n=1 Tax=unclassified Halalkalibacter TaxID=2893063 RepID=UPI001FF3C26D|nr:single-stranded DNA-binding protein [Halalkalibacter sp. APA_J-10(15)]MCK0469803.1 single-stranded DNA-binding protein [Halalkalibacter sp. APA_J-10(15)]
MLNRVVLVGRLTRDPELRYTPNGVAVANFTLAVNRTFSNRQGEREADFINCVVWQKQAENVANYLKKGSLAGVDGRIQTRSYDNNEGRRVFVTEVVAESVQFLEPRNSGGAGNESFGGPPSSAGNNDFGKQPNRPSGFDDPFANDGKPIDISDDDLPF